MQTGLAPPWLELEQHREQHSAPLRATELDARGARPLLVIITDRLLQWGLALPPPLPQACPLRSKKHAAHISCGVSPTSKLSPHSTHTGSGSDGGVIGLVGTIRS